MKVLSLLLILTGLLPAQVASTLNNRTLKKLAYATGSGSNSCDTAGCVITSGVIPPVSVVCPSSSLPSSCTYFVHVDIASAHVSAFDTGFVKILVDGLPPNPGPTDANGAVVFQADDQNSLDDGNHLTIGSHSVAIVAKLSNKTNNQAHTVTVSVGCQDSEGDGGCRVVGNFIVVEIAVSKP